MKEERISGRREERIRRYYGVCTGTDALSEKAKKKPLQEKTTQLQRTKRLAK
ncbi:hypothetical protein [Succinimonas amylolytica]|uniref:hypothetical protein n=1 Tax=Succinimonas amylolytica TaxID=83769 RepID=UPI00036D0E60|nr:hypothetical protein [Succinimonas amylolytica]